MFSFVIKRILNILHCLLYVVTVYNIKIDFRNKKQKFECIVSDYAKQAARQFLFQFYNVAK